MPVREPTPMSSIAGEFITETLEYDGGRQVTAYVPAAATEAVVFAGDGQLITSWGEVLEAADLPPTMIIGAHRVEDETLRLSRDWCAGWWLHLTECMLRRDLHDVAPGGGAQPVEERCPKVPFRRGEGHVTDIRGKVLDGASALGRRVDKQRGQRHG
jgi:hypothetical protein